MKFISLLDVNYLFLSKIIFRLIKIYLDHFYFDNIDFNHFILTLILITNIFKASNLKQDGPAELGGMIKVIYEFDSF